jgi:hypothetical protein
MLLTLASATKAQTPNCGVEVEGPTEVDVGAPLKFKAKVSGMGQTKQELKWVVSAGTIMMGQGTDELTVDTTGLGGVVLTATVALSRAPLGCSQTASITTTVRPPGDTFVHAFDQYGELKFEDEKSRLDNFAIQLSNDELSTGYILMSAGQVTYENETAEHLARAKSWIVDRDIDRNRVITVDCGFSQDLTIYLRIVPTGATPPTCDIIEVPFSEVKFTKPRPKSAKKPH